MDIHILDWVMWILIVIIFWKILEILGDGEYTEELGGLIGLAGALLITIIHIVLFGFMGWNWIDMFQGVDVRNLINLGL